MSTHVSGPSDMLACIPACLGFTPTNSLVLLAFGDGETGSVLHYVCRADLPTSTETSADEFTMALLSRLKRTGTSRLIMVVVGDTTEYHDAGYREFVDTVTLGLTGADMPVTGRYWLPALTAGATWRCYDTDTSGTLTDPRSTIVAAELAARGEVTFDSRDDLIHLLTPTTEPTVLQRRAHQLGDEPHHEAESPATRHVRLTALRHAAGQATSGILPETDDEIVPLLSALSDPLVRDCCVGWHGPVIEQLWMHLTRNAPDPWAADPATLLAIAVHRRGAGPMSNIACERALAANPDHRLAQLMQQAHASGLSPSDLETVISGTAAEAEARLG